MKVLMISGKHSADRGCSDCAHLEAHVSWWCKSADALKARGTNIPGVINCPFWKPCPTKAEVGFFSRLFGDWILFRGRG